MIYLILTIIILCQAVEDGLWERKQKKWSKRAESLGILLLLSLFVFVPIPTWKYVFVVVMQYLAIRVALFDLIINLVAGCPINYLGNTSGWDKLMKRLKTWQFWVLRGFALAFSIFWYIKLLR